VARLKIAERPERYLEIGASGSRIPAPERASTAIATRISDPDGNGKTWSSVRGFSRLGVWVPYASREVIPSPVKVAITIPV
jgi:hypothetical protein